jgi:glycerol-3-phosphate acyltransferase PlsY
MGPRGDCLEIVKYWSASSACWATCFPDVWVPGGKGILSGGTVAFLWTGAGSAGLGRLLLLTLLTRFFSLGSIYAAASFPVGTGCLSAMTG